MTGVCFHSCAILENKAWFVAVDNHSMVNNHFMWMDINTGETHYVMPKGNTIFNTVVDSMIVADREIYWAEQDGKRLLSYNLDTEICKTYTINDVEMQNWASFSLIANWRDSIILVPKYSDKILIFDFLKKIFIEVEDIFGKYMDKSDEGYVNYSFVFGDDLYLFLTDNQTVLKYSLDTAKVCTVDRQDLKRKIISAYWHENVLFVLDSEGNILMVDKEFKLLKDCVTVNKKYKGYARLFVINNRLVILPSKEDDILVINLEDGKEERVITPDDFTYKDIQWGKYMGYTEQEDLIMLPNRMSNYVLVLYKNNDYKLKWIKPGIDSKTKAQYIRYTGKNTFEEDDLELLIDYLSL